jgi:hypothetical protein
MIEMAMCIKQQLRIKFFAADKAGKSVKFVPVVAATINYSAPSGII